MPFRDVIAKFWSRVTSWYLSYDFNLNQGNFSQADLSYVVISSILELISSHLTYSSISILENDLNGRLLNPAVQAAGAGDDAAAIRQAAHPVILGEIGRRQLQISCFIACIEIST